MPMNRRRFLRDGAAIATLGVTMLSVLVRTLYAAPADAEPAVPGVALVPPGTMGERTLVVLQLGGGNDGLSALPPYLNGAYHDLRPLLALDEADGVAPLEEGVGLHPSLAPLLPLWDAGRLAIVQNVGYPGPNRSHFRSMEIWHTARLDEQIGEGWLGRYLDASAAADGNRWRAVGVGSFNGLALAGDLFVPTMQSIDAYQLQPDPRHPADAPARLAAWRALHAAAGARSGSLALISKTGLEAFASTQTLQAAGAAYEPLVEYPAGNAVAAGLQTVAQLIGAGLGTTIAYVTMAGASFDTHAAQADRQAELLGQVGEAIAALLEDVALQGRGNDVVLLAFSEFGRRVAVNGSDGTDHGAAGPVFIAGAPVRGGLYGDLPDLRRLDEGDLRYSTDFRSVYATLLEDWLGADSEPVLFGRFETLPLF